jgi:hypothetical protein
LHACDFSDFSYYIFINTVHKEGRKALLLTFHTLNNVESYDNIEYHNEIPR